jgi:hypothetical protein
LQIVTDVLGKEEDEPEMFDTNYMKYFYNPKFEKDEKIRDAWYIYVLRFLPLVCKQWRDSVSSDKLKNQVSMFTSITLSDEALVRWFIVLWVALSKNEKLIKTKEEQETHQEKEQCQSNEENNQDVMKNEKKKRGIKKGPHDTKHNINLYTVIHNKIEIARKDHYVSVQWNIIFWEEVKKRKSDLLETRKQAKYSSIQNSYVAIQLPDLNEDQGFLAELSIDFHAAAQALVSMSPPKRIVEEERDSFYCVNQTQV